MNDPETTEDHERVQGQEQLKATSLPDEGAKSVAVDWEGDEVII